MLIPYEVSYWYCPDSKYAMTLKQKQCTVQVLVKHQNEWHLGLVPCKIPVNHG